MMGADSLAMWVIYENPSDYRGKFVVRIHRPGRDGSVVAEREPRAVVDTLAQARAVVPPLLYRMDRHPDDDPVIVEVWF